jgi:hypothetical protein
VLRGRPRSGPLAEVRRRQAVARSISALRLTPVLFEAGARPQPPQTLYRASARRAAGPLRGADDQHLLNHPFRRMATQAGATTLVAGR